MAALETGAPHSLASHPGYRADIDGLRAVAVLAVVGFHAFPQWVGGGFVGVDVFFVISGFLISGIIFAGLDGGSFSYAGFYARRIRRIFPALLPVLLACLAFGWFAVGADDYRALGKHVAAGAAFVSNLALWSEAGYFDAAAEAKPLLHLWSLGIEEQFYIVWPLLLGWAWRRWNFFAFAGLIAAASFALSLYLTDTHMVAAFYSPLTRFWELMAGGLLAYARLRKPEGAASHANLFAPAGLVALGAGMLLFDSHTAFPGWAALLPVGGAVLLIAAGPGAWCNRRLLAARPLVGVGLISYPLYLWHWPLLVFANRAGAAAAATQWTAVALAFVLAWLTYLLLEKPVRGGRRPAAIAVSLAVMMAAVGCAGGYVLERDGLAMRTGNQHLLATQGWLDAQRWSDADYFSPACHSRYPEAYYCMLAPDAAAPSVALLGDSYANALYYGLRDAYAKRRQTLVQLGNGGCPPLLDIASDYTRQGMNDCTARNNTYLRKIAADKSISTVVLAGNWHLYLIGRRMRPAPGAPAWKLTMPDRPDLTDNPAVFAEAFARTVKLLSDAGKRIVFIHQTPELDYRLSDCAPERDAPPGQCRVERRREEAYLDEYKRLLAPLLRQYPAIAVVDPLTQFCDAAFCYSMRDSVLLYRDGLHLSRGGSAWLGERIALPE